MQVYVTNAALGYNYYAFLIRLDKSENGYNYLCIDTDGFDSSDTYIIGECVKDLEDIYVSMSSYDANESSLKGSFQFENR